MRKLTRIEENNLALVADGKDEFALFHVTKTILNKSIQDCNSEMRRLFKNTKIMDYDDLKAGDKKFLEGTFENGLKTKISFYRAKGRGDKRIWFSGLKDVCAADSVMAVVVDKTKQVSLICLSVKK